MEGSICSISLIESVVCVCFEPRPAASAAASACALSSVAPSSAAVAAAIVSASLHTAKRTSDPGRASEQKKTESGTAATRCSRASQRQYLRHKRPAVISPASPKIRLE